MSARALLLSLMLLLVGAGAGALFGGDAGERLRGLPDRLLGNGSGVKADAAPTKGAGERPVPVEASEVTLGRIIEEISAVGTLRSAEAVVLRPEIAGRIRSIHFVEGTPVPEGALLVLLDDALFEAEVAEASARVNLSERNYARAIELFEKRASSASARDEALAQLEIDRASLELERVQLEKTRIHAPFAGILGLRHVSVGSYVNAGQDLVNLEAIDPIKVDFRIPERHLGALHPGQQIRIGVDAFPDAQFEGEVYALDPLVDPQGRSVAVRARIPNPERQLRPGLFARVSLIVEERPEALLVPEQALVPRADGSYLYRVVDGKAHFTRVELGKRQRGEVEVVRGLERGDLVVIAGHQKLRDGAPVELIEPGA